MEIRVFKKNKKSAAPVERTARRVRSTVAPKPSFSYYGQHRNESPLQRGSDSVTARSRTSSEPVKHRWYQGRNWSFWVIVIAIVAIGLELVVLRPDGRVIIRGTVSSKQSVSTNDYKRSFDGLLSKSFLNRNKLTIDANGIARQMKNDHPELESVFVETPLLGTHPSMYVTVSEPVFVIQQGSSSYLLSQSGYVAGDTGQTKTSLPVVLDETGEIIGTSKQLLPAAHVTFMKTVYYELTKQGIEVAGLVLPKAKAFELDVRVRNKPYFLKFNYAEDAMQQSGAAVATIGQLGQTTPREYIDLRVPGRVYYK